jgi:2-octaprenylphenol hydroxylase
MATFDVLIIGAGVAGLTQALALAQAGFRVAVIDHGQRPSPFRAEDLWDNRVFALTRQSQQLLTSLGVWQELLDRRLTYYDQMRLAWLGCADRPLCLSASDAAEPDLGHVVEQSVMRDALLSLCEATEYCVFYWGQAWSSLQLATEVSSVELTSGQRVQAALVVAADGAHSPVRAYLKANAVSWSNDTHAIVTTIKCEQPHQHIARQWFLNTGTLALLPLAEANVSSLVWSLPSGLANEQLCLSDLAFCRSLVKHTDHTVGQLSVLTSRLSFPLQSSYNQDFAQTGLAFIADAAHVIHPLAGQGLNLGLADVALLTQVLSKARALGRPIGHASILKPYARARKVAAQQTIALMTLLEKGGQFSANYAHFFSRCLTKPTKMASLLKVFTTTFALHSLNK